MILDPYNILLFIVIGVIVFTILSLFVFLIAIINGSIRRYTDQRNRHFQEYDRIRKELDRKTTR